MLYVLESPELKELGIHRCKVGISETHHSMTRRMCNHRTGSPVYIDVIWLCEEAGYAEEQQVLEAMIDFRRRKSEWLEASAAEIIQFIEWTLGLAGVGQDIIDGYNKKTRGMDHER